MSLLNVPAGKDLPEDIYVVIEIPANADPIKYEVDKESGALFVDRFMSTAMFYPCNYGYINHTLSLDGDPVDVLVPTPYPLEPGSVIRCRPVGVLKMTDESGEDAKLVAVPHTKLSKEYDHIKDVNDLPELLKAQITHFFEHYKDLEKGKWVKVDGWDNAEAAKAEIIASFERAKSNSAALRLSKTPPQGGVFFLARSHFPGGGSRLTRATNTQRHRSGQPTQTPHLPVAPVSAAPPGDKRASATASRHRSGQPTQTPALTRSPGKHSATGEQTVPVPQPPRASPGNQPKHRTYP
jgi:inorganic pyrophosphatase